MKSVGIVGIGFFLIGNLYMLWFYVIDIIDYFSDKFNYDGIRYLEPLILADILFVISIVLLCFLLGFSKYLLGFLLIALIHNVAIGGMGVEMIPFIGLIGVIVATAYCFHCFQVFRT